MPPKLEMQDKITIGLYSVQSGTNFNRAALAEVANIKKIKEKFDAAAKKHDRSPPKIVISVSLIPDWRNGSSYSNSDYIAAKDNFLREMQHLLSENGLDDVELEYFYHSREITAEEKGYLEKLQSKGSNADMIKTHAIIRPANQSVRHLQMDSNTQIHSYEGLYADTFGRSEQSDALYSDALNASYYDADYVSAHNKIVYTVPGGKLAPRLYAVHMRYCSEHGSDHEVPSRQEEKTSKNSIYSKDFVVALQECELTHHLEKPPVKSGEAVKVVYPADLSKTDSYRLTRYVVTAVNMSWKPKPGSSADTAMSVAKALPAVEIGDARCDYASFYVAIRKFTGDLSIHKYGVLGQEKFKQDMATAETDGNLYKDEITRQQLFEVSDVEIDKAIILNFYQNSISELESARQGYALHNFSDDNIRELKHFMRNKNLPNVALLEKIETLSEVATEYTATVFTIAEIQEIKQFLESHQCKALSDKIIDPGIIIATEGHLARQFLDNPNGNKLTQELFNCTAAELHADPVHYAAQPAVAAALPATRSTSAMLASFATSSTPGAASTSSASIPPAPDAPTQTVPPLAPISTVSTETMTNPISPRLPTLGSSSD